jgi:hypothetical protein
MLINKSLGLLYVVKTTNRPSSFYPYFTLLIDVDNYNNKFF